MLLVNLSFPNQTAIVGQQTIHHDFQRDIPVAKLRQHWDLISTQINVKNIRIYRIWVVIPQYKNHDCKHHRWSFSGGTTNSLSRSMQVNTKVTSTRIIITWHYLFLYSWASASNSCTQQQPRNCRTTQKTCCQTNNINNQILSRNEPLNFVFPNI